MQDNDVTERLDVIDVLHLTSSEDRFVERLVRHVLVLALVSITLVLLFLVVPKCHLVIRPGVRARQRPRHARDALAPLPPAARLLDVVRVLVIL